MVLDMDNTLLSFETLDTVVETALTAALAPAAVERAMQRVDALMQRGMEGTALLEETIPARLHVARDLGAPVRPEHFTLVAAMVPNAFSAGVVSALAALCNKEGAPSIHISVVSGGPQECVDAATAHLSALLSVGSRAPLGITGVGNTICVDDAGNFDSDRSRIHNTKAQIVREITAHPERTIMIGDAVTDAQVFDDGAASYFIAFGMWVEHEALFSRSEHSPVFQKVRTQSEFEHALEAAVTAISI